MSAAEFASNYADVSLSQWQQSPQEYCRVMSEMISSQSWARVSPAISYDKANLHAKATEEKGEKLSGQTQSHQASGYMVRVPVSILEEVDWSARRNVVESKPSFENPIRTTQAPCVRLDFGSAHSDFLTSKLESAIDLSTTRQGISGLYDELSLVVVDGLARMNGPSHARSNYDAPSIPPHLAHCCSLQHDDAMKSYVSQVLADLNRVPADGSLPESIPGSLIDARQSVLSAKRVDNEDVSQRSVIEARAARSKGRLVQDTPLETVPELGCGAATGTFLEKPTFARKADTPSSQACETASVRPLQVEESSHQSHPAPLGSTTTHNGQLPDQGDHARSLVSEHDASHVQDMFFSNEMQNRAQAEQGLRVHPPELSQIANSLSAVKELNAMATNVPETVVEGTPPDLPVGSISETGDFSVQRNQGPRRPTSPEAYPPVCNEALSKVEAAHRPASDPALLRSVSGSKPPSSSHPKAESMRRYLQNSPRGSKKAADRHLRDVPSFTDTSKEKILLDRELESRAVLEQYIQTDQSFADACKGLAARCVWMTAPCDRVCWYEVHA